MRSSDIDATFLDTTITRFTRAEWDLLVRLPGQVVVAATTGADGTSASMSEAIAGLDAVAAGRGSPNALVRQVVGTIYAERDFVTGPDSTGPDSTDTDSTPGRESIGATGFGSAVDRTGRYVEVLVTCRQAAAVLAAHGTLADRLAYEGWLGAIAVRVCRSPAPVDRPCEGIDRPADRALGASVDQRFLAALTSAFQANEPYPSR